MALNEVPAFPLLAAGTSWGKAMLQETPKPCVPMLTLEHAALPLTPRAPKAAEATLEIQSKTK